MRQLHDDITKLAMNRVSYMIFLVKKSSKIKFQFFGRLSKKIEKFSELEAIKSRTLKVNSGSECDSV